MLSGLAGASAAGAVGLAAWRTGLLDAVEDAVGPRPHPPGPPQRTPTPPAPDSTPVPTSGAVADMLEEASVGELRRGLDARAFSIVELTQAALDRIAAMDRVGPALGAVIETNPEALDIARQLDLEARAGRVRGPLHGIPVLLKDIFATRDRMRTGAGSLALAQNAVARDAFIVARLREAGAIILGKANLSEFSNFMGDGSPSGWSARGGQTRNPYVLTHSPWGSSSGSAVAVAASYVPLAVGAETDGSILCPASACGVVGLKPTVGLVSRRGAVPISFTQDSPGPMARSVEDAALLLGVIAGQDPEDPAYGELGFHTPPARFAATPVPASGSADYARAFDADGLRGARIGVCRSLFGFDPDADALAEEALAAMREAGAEIVDEIYIGAVESIASETEYAVLLTEFAHGIQEFLAAYMPDGPIRSLQDIIDFNVAHADQELRYGNQRVLEEALFAGSLWDEDYRWALETNLALARDEGIDRAMHEHALDALVAPTAGLPTPLTPAGEDFSGSSSRLPAVAGYPSISVPIGLHDGVPAGLHLFGRAFSEATLLRLAHGLERAIQARQRPRYLAEPPAEDALPSDGTGGTWPPN